MGNCCPFKRGESNYQKSRGRETLRVFKRVEKAIIGEDETGATCVNEYRLLGDIHPTDVGRFCVCEDQHVNKNQNSRFACKIIPRTARLSNNEVAVLKNLHHSNLVKLIEVIDDPEVCRCHGICVLFLAGFV